MKFQFEFAVAKSFFKLCSMLALMISLFCSETTGQTKGNGIPDGLVLKTEHGPWFVMAKSYDSSVYPNAKQLAEQLASELRRDFKLQAYCWNKRFDYTPLEEGPTLDGQTRRMKKKRQSVVDGYGVLIGDFESIDSPEIVEMLAKIKRITPKMLASGVEPTDPKSDAVNVSAYRRFLKAWDTGKEKDVKLGPMGDAFVTRNPLLPPDFYKAPVLDKFVKSLNEEKGLSENSLIDCPGKFTVRVAVFRGEDQSVSWGRSTNGLSEKDKVSQLDLAAERASLTTRALRRAGYEAYQFHDRTQSFVTVGSFDSLGETDNNNHLVFDRGIQDIIARFGATKKVTRSQYGNTQTPTLLFDLVDQKTIPPEFNTKDKKALAEWLTKYSVAFDLVPSPMAVPRMPVYSGMLFGKNRR